MLDFSTRDRQALEANAAKAAALLRALANERRLLVLCQLSEGELSVGALQGRLGISQSALSQHLAVLREEKLVATRRESQTIFYRIADPAAAKIITALTEIYCPLPQQR